MEKCHPRDQLFSKFKSNDQEAIEILDEIGKYELPKKYDFVKSLKPDFGWEQCTIISSQ